MRQFSGSTLKLYDHWARAELNLINSLSISTLLRLLVRFRKQTKYIYTCFIRFKFVKALPFYEVVKRNSFWINEELRFSSPLTSLQKYGIVLTICYCLMNNSLKFIHKLYKPFSSLWWRNHQYNCDWHKQNIVIVIH